jgi:hypothetical protein
VGRIDYPGFDELGQHEVVKKVNVGGWKLSYPVSWELNGKKDRKHFYYQSKLRY